jgi:hypothetical protein
VTAWLCVLAVVVFGAALITLLATRAQREAGPTVSAFDDLRRDLRLGVVELRVEQDRIARRIDALRRRGNGPGQG